MRSLLRALELFLRHVLVYPLLRLAFQNSQSDQTIDLQTIQRILILRYDRIGDIIVTTPIFRKLKVLNPRLEIGVIASEANASIISHDPNIDHVHILKKNWLELIRQLREAKQMNYDVVLNFIFNRTTSGGILANLVAPRGFKVGQGGEKYRFYFNRLLNLQRGSMHMVEVLADFVTQVFGVTFDDRDLQFRIAVDRDSISQVDDYLQEHSLSRRTEGGLSGRLYVVFNLSATDAVRQITKQQAVATVGHLAIFREIPTVLISSRADAELLREIQTESDSTNCIRYPTTGSASLLQIANLIEGASFVVTPDTSIIHFASAVQTPVIGLFTPLQVTNEWLPYKVEASAVFAENGQSVRNIPDERILTALDAFITKHIQQRD